MIALLHKLRAKPFLQLILVLVFTGNSTLGYTTCCLSVAGESDEPVASVAVDRKSVLPCHQSSASTTTAVNPGAVVDAKSIDDATNNITNGCCAACVVTTVQNQPLTVTLHLQPADISFIATRFVSLRNPPPFRPPINHLS